MATAAFKDLFSLQAADYARFRPFYPPELYAWLAAKAPARRLAIDVGTGNGQAAVALAAHFERVIGVEPSDGQRANATPAPHVEYRPGTAEETCDYVYVLCLGRAPSLIERREGHAARLDDSVERLRRARLVGQPLPELHGRANRGERIPHFVRDTG